MIIVDRIEGGFAVVYNENKREDIPLEKLPQTVREGDVLVFCEGGYRIDEQAVQKLKEENMALEDELFK